MARTDWRRIPTNPILVPQMVPGGTAVPYPWWKLQRTPTGPEAIVHCWFGHQMLLGKHTVHADGSLTPSPVQCTTEGCTFVARLRLQGWDKVQGTVV